LNVISYPRAIKTNSQKSPTSELNSIVVLTPLAQFEIPEPFDTSIFPEDATDVPVTFKVDPDEVTQLPFKFTFEELAVILGKLAGSHPTVGVALL